MYREAEILQQRIEVTALGRHREAPVEGIRGKQQEGLETDTDHAHDRQHPCQHHGRQVAREQRDGHGPAAQDQRPQQQRALVRPPYGRHLVHQRQLGVAVLCYVQHREVIGQERVHQAGERHSHEKELAQRGRSRQRHPAGCIVEAADHGKDRQHQRQAQCQDQGKIAELRDHGVAVSCCMPLTPSSWAAFSASATSGGM